MRDLKLPVLALLSAASFSALWALKLVAINRQAPFEALLPGVVLAALYGWPALFGLARSFGAGPFGRSLRAAAIVLSPVAVTLALATWDVMAPAASWPENAAGAWLVLQLLIVPACWALARFDVSRRPPSI